MRECDFAVYKSGTHVFTMHSIEPEQIERLVKKIAELSGQRVDWHYFGGRAVIKAVGDIAKVHEAIKIVEPEYMALLKLMIGKYLGPEHPINKYCEGDQKQ